MKLNDFMRIPSIAMSASSSRPSPQALLAAARARQCIRLVLPPVPRPPLSPADRAYFRELRAAEMAVWESFGRQSEPPAPADFGRDGAFGKRQSRFN